jgi:processing peptidase subunit alpha
MVECLPDQVVPALNVVADCVLDPHYDADEVAHTKADLEIQIDDYRNQPAQFVPEMLHAIAFGSHADSEGGVGRPLLCSQRDLSQLSTSTAEQFLQRRLIGPRIVVIGHGVDHSVLVSHAKSLVGSVPADAPSSGANGNGGARASAYRGGAHSLEATAEDEDVTHIAVGFEGARAGSKESYVACLLQLLLGGGDSFSTGGPGKGMHSMLYRDVLVRYGQVQTCVAFNHCYSDTGLFGVFASAANTNAQVLTELVVTELAIVARGVSAEAFERAKNQLKGQVLMNIESRLVLFEDMARQMVVAGEYIDPATVCKRIDAVTIRDLSQFVDRAMQGRPSYLAFGPKPAIASAQDASGLQFALQNLRKV